jgi:predicted nuclease of predicted toxin-antitoxin system
LSLLFDENLSPSLPQRLADLYPGSFHVRNFNYSSMPDIEVWRLAQEQGLCIVSADADFYALSFTQGPTPKVIWLQINAGKTADIELCLRGNHQLVRTFLGKSDDAILILQV